MKIRSLADCVPGMFATTTTIDPTTTARPIPALPLVTQVAEQKRGCQAHHTKAADERDQQPVHVRESGGYQPVGGRRGKREPPTCQKRRHENCHRRQREPQRHVWCAGQVATDDQFEHAGDPENRHQQLEPVLVRGVPDSSHAVNVLQIRPPRLLPK